MLVVVNNLILTVTRGISQWEIVQEVRVKGTIAHIECPVRVFLL